MISGGTIQAMTTNFIGGQTTTMAQNFSDDPTLPGPVLASLEHLYEGYSVDLVKYDELQDVYEIQLSDEEDEIVVKIDSDGNLIHDGEDLDEESFDSDE